MARANNPDLKKANQEIEYTSFQIQELKRCVADPVYFIKNYIRIVHPVKGTVPFNLYDYQEQMINTYKNNKDVIVLSARQSGKHLSLDTIIPTQDGWTTMGELKVGDTVLAANGLPTKVTEVFPIYEDKVCYKVHFSTGETIIASAEHLWEVEDVYKKGKKQVLSTQNMVDRKMYCANSRGYIETKFTVKTTKSLQLNNQDLLLHPYVLGVWLGDGSYHVANITCHNSDIEIIENVKQIYPLKSIYQWTKTKSPETFQYQFNFLDKIRKLSLYKNKHIPLQYLRASHEQRLALLQGIMDTDGYVSNNGNCELTLTNKRLIDDCFHLICSLGLKPTITERHIKGKLPHTRWSIIFTPFECNLNPFRLTRKRKLVKKQPHPTRIQSTYKRGITKIERIESVPVRCITVDNPDHTYLIGPSCIPTHNSECSGAYLLWVAIFQFNKTILIASNKNENAMLMINRIRFMYEKLPMWLKPGINAESWNKHTISFDNESSIVSTATSENAGRGMPISILYLDEFAFVPSIIQNSFWTSILPTLSQGGDCIITSTPNGDTNLFAELWRGAETKSNGFESVRIYWDQPPGRDEKFKQDQIAKLTEIKWRQEYECEFISSDALLINSLKLQNISAVILKNKPKFKIKDVIFWYDVKPGTTYLIGVDPATGSGKDFTVFTVYEFPAMKQIAEYRSNTTSTNDAYDVLKNLLKYIADKECTIYFSIENNGVGEGIISLFEADDDRPDAEFISEDGRNKRGMTTVSKSKLKACVNFRELLEKDKMSICSPTLMIELKHFVRKRGSYDHQEGSTSDCISATLIIVRLIEEIAIYDQQAFDKLYQEGTDVDYWSQDDMLPFENYDPDPWIN